MISAIDVKGLGILDPLGIPLDINYKPSNNTNKPRFRIHNNKMILYISNTLINQFFERGEKKEYCPWAVYRSYMISKDRSDPTAAMLKGSYFETKCIGGGAGGSGVHSLPLLKSGKLSTDNKRIDEQVVQFKVLKDKYGMVLKDDLSNTQVKGMIHYPQDHWVDIEVFATGEADWITPIGNYNGHSFGNSIVDLKLTGNMSSSYGKFAWTPREFINTQQLTHYWHVFGGLPTFFWVFDYPATGMMNEIIPVNHDINHSNAKLAGKAKWRIKTFHELMRLTINEIAFNFQEGWKKNPDPALCKKCPVMGCDKRNLLNEL